MNYRKMADHIIEGVGGGDNIEKVWSCVSRLRFLLHDLNKVDHEYIQNVEGVHAIRYAGPQFQVVIGLDVIDVLAEVQKILHNNCDK